MTQGTSNILTSLPIYGLIASLTLFYQQIKSGITKFFGFFIKKCNIPSELLEPVAIEFCNNSFYYNSDNYRIHGITVFSKFHKRWIEIYIKKFKSQFFLYHNKIPLLMVAENDNSYFLYYLKFTFNFEKFINEIIKNRNQKVLNTKLTKPYEFRIETFKGKSFKVWDNLEGKPSNYSSNSSATINKDNNISDESKYILLNTSTSFENKLKERFLGVDNLEEYDLYLQTTKKNKYQLTQEGKFILNQLEKWYSLRDWYDERNIAWRRGICLCGVAGNGKSSLILEVAKKAGMPLFIFDISSMDNTEFEKYLEEISHRHGILLFEDIDSIFNGRENMTKNKYGSLTFDFFINKLSGIKSINNKFIFFTTNNINKLDPALIRPGRIDEIIEIKPLTFEEKSNLANIFIENDPDLVEKVLNEGKEDTTAQFENRCTKAILEKVWEKT